MKNSVRMSVIAAMLLLNNGAYGYDEGGSSPYTVKFGYEAGTNNTNDGEENTFMGYESGYSNTDGDYNVFTGSGSGYNNTTGDGNVFIGRDSGFSNTIGGNNVFTGINSGFRNTAGYGNVFTGSNSGYNNTTGSNNVFTGYYSGNDTISGKNNVFIGSFSGYSNLTGDENVYIGRSSGYNNNGFHNIFIGSYSGATAEVNGSVFIGYEAGASADRNNTLYISNSNTNDPLIYGEFDTKLVKINGDLNTTGPVTASFSGSTDKQALKMMDIRVNNTNDDKKSDVGFSMTNVREDFAWSFRTWEPTKGFAIAKYGNGATKEFRLEDTDPTDATTVVLRLANGAYCDGVWHDASSRSYKKDIKPLDSEAAQNAFAKLRPVTYVYKSHPQDTHVGFIAEDVPQLVADPGRKSISTVDIVAVLTKVVQLQQSHLQKTTKELKEKEQEIARLKVRIKKVETLLSNLALKVDPSNSSMQASRK